MSEKSPFIRVERIGGHAWQYLTPQPRKGRVVSIFSGGINLLFEDGEAFVPVQMHAVPLHPWAIEIAGTALLFAEGTPANAEEEELSVGNTRIVFSATQIEELSLPRFSAKETAIVRRNLPILAWFVEEARKGHLPDPFQERIDAILACWHKSGDPAILLDLIGLGAGSTPSGDDVLIGILAGMSLFEYVEDRVEETLACLRTGIQETARDLTPLPSAQMLLAACDRSFAEPILALLAAIASSSVSHNGIIEQCARIVKLGHHSGFAIVSGLAGPIYSI